MRTKRDFKESTPVLEDAVSGLEAANFSKFNPANHSTKSLSFVGDRMLCIHSLQCLDFLYFFLGSDKFEEAMTLMTGKPVPKWFIICWKFITPAISLVWPSNLQLTMQCVCRKIMYVRAQVLNNMLLLWDTCKTMRNCTKRYIFIIQTVMQDSYRRKR